jgi:hypothetical protein
MIFMYNETQTPWSSSEVAPKLNRLGIEMTAKDGKVKRIGIMASNTIQIENMEELVNMTTVVPVYNEVSGVYYQKRDQSPVISENAKFDKDIFFININLDGSIVSNIDAKGTQVLNYLIANNQLALILSKAANTRDDDVSITLYNSKTNEEKVYTFTYNSNGYYDIVVNADTVEKEVSNYKLTRFRPAVITHCILVDNKDIDALYKVLHKPEIFFINTFNSVDELPAIIDELRTNKYRAVTLFADTDDAKELGGDAYSSIKNGFRSMNVLLNDGKVVRR